VDEHRSWWWVPPGPPGPFENVIEALWNAVVNEVMATAYRLIGVALTGPAPDSVLGTRELRSSLNSRKREILEALKAETFRLKLARETEIDIAFHSIGVFLLLVTLPIAIVVAEEKSILAGISVLVLGWFVLPYFLPRIPPPRLPSTPAYVRRRWQIPIRAGDKTRQAYDELHDAIQALLESELTNTLNDRFATPPDQVAIVTRHGLFERFESSFEISTGALDSALSLLSTMRGASVGLAGPRGSGKSALIRAIMHGRSSDGSVPVAVLTSAPAG
jgi:hypothetical protein